MADQPPSPDEGQRPALPWVLFAISTAVAVLATSAFVLLLTRRATGPVEVLRQFVQAAHNGDCEGSYDLFAERTKTALTRDDWCDRLQAAEFPATFRAEEVLLEGEIATVRIRHPDGNLDAWQLEREGRTWGVVGRVAAGGAVRPEDPVAA